MSWVKSSSFQTDEHMNSEQSFLYRYLERFLSILKNRSMIQHVYKTTHRSWNTLDLIITPDYITETEIQLYHENHETEIQL